MLTKTLTALTAASLVALSSGTAHAATPLDSAAAAVQRDARHLDGSRQDRLAWATFQYVTKNISSARNVRLPVSQRPVTVQQAIAKRAGACGNATAVALAIADRIGLKARPVEFYYRERDNSIGSHIMAEFNVNGRWQLYDVLFNTVYRGRDGRLLGASSLWKLPLATQLARQERGPSDSRTGYLAEGHDPYRYLADPRSEMTINDHGAVSMSRQGNVFTVVPNRPNYVGQGNTYGTRRSNMNQLLTGGYMTQITVHLTSACANGRLVAQSQITTSAAISATTTTVTLPVRGTSVRLSMQGGCYAVVQSVVA